MRGFSPHGFFSQILFRKGPFLMIRKIVLVGVALQLVPLSVGCGNANGSRATGEIPINASEGVDKKGKASKSMEASMVDPNFKKK
jgi:hypothetical protein